MINAIRFFVAVVVSLACSAAFAQTQTKVWHESYQPVYYPSADAACRAVQTQYEPTASSDGMSATCNFYQMVGTEKRVYSGKVVVAEYRTCTAPQVPTFPSGACGAPPPPPDPCPVGPSYVRKFAYGNAAAPYKMPTHEGGCVVYVVEVLVCRTETVNGSTGTYCMFEIKRTGAEWDGSETPSEPESQTGTDNTADPKVNVPPSSGNGSCPAGTTQGGVDSSGIPICMGGGTAPEPPAPPPTTTTQPDTTVTNPDGSVTVTQVQQKKNTDGSVTTTTVAVTTNADGSVTRDTTVSVSQTPLGTQGRDTPDPSDEKYDLCKQHPDLNVCRNSTVAGACEAISCTGDAIQCATLREAAQIQCRQKRTEDELKESSLFAAGSAAVAGTDMEGLPTPENASQFDVETQLDQAGFLGGGACFTDKTVTIQGHTITLPFSAACDYLIVFRYVVMIIAGFVSFRLLSTATLKD